MTPTEPYKDPTGLTRWLHSLAAADILISIINLTVGISAGWPWHFPVNGDSSTIVGIITVIFFFQIAVRLLSLTMRARWTFQLVANARRFQSLAASQRWAWLGFFMPVLSLWLPARTIGTLMSLGDAGNSRADMLLLLWWFLRWTTCFSGSLVIFFICAIIFGHQEEAFIVMTAFLIPAFFGVPSAGLGAYIAEVTARRQSAPNDIQQAAVF